MVTQTELYFRLDRKGLSKEMRFLAILIKTSSFFLIFFITLSLHTSPSQVKVKNVILMIGDGMGYNQIDAANLYQYGERGCQVYESFPISYAMMTHQAGRFDEHGNMILEWGYDPQRACSWFDYVKVGATDSAAAATAMSTGVKTYSSAIGVDLYKKPLKHFMEYGKELGKAAGVVTSVQFSHATPAGFVAHNVSRNNYAEIAQEMILDSKVDVIIGCGHPLFDNNGNRTNEEEFKYVGGKGLWNGLLAGNINFDLDGDGKIDNSVEDADGDLIPDKWTLIQDLEEFRNLMSGQTPKRILGVPKVRETLQCRRKVPEDAGYSISEEKLPYQTPLNPNVPTLAEMALSAINVLDDDPDGFMLMIEGGAIDWACHDNWSARLIEEQIDFNRAVEAVVNWIEKHSSWEETLLIVTGDHETGYLTGPNSGPDPDDENDTNHPVWYPLSNNGSGNMPGMNWHSKNHTNSLIPLFAKGSGSELFASKVAGIDPVRGFYIDNTAIAKVVLELLGVLDTSSDTLSLTR